MSKVKPLPEGSFQTQDFGGYEELDLDELDRALKGGKDPIAEATAKAQEEQDDDDLIDPNPDEVVEEEAEETDASDEVEETEEEVEKDEKADEANEEEKEEEDPLSKRIRLLERRLELEGLERTKESEARKRAELLASKQAGRAGFLQQRLEKSPSKAQPKKAEAADDEDAWADEASDAQETRPDQNRPSTELPQEWKEDRAELVKIAINDEGNSFASMHAGELEEMPQKFLDRLQELMKEEAEPYADEFLNSSMKTVRKLARSLMNSAYATARIEFADQVAENSKAEATTRKAESVAKSKRRKAKAAISGGGTKAKPQPKAKSYEDMDLEELEAEMRKEFGENYRLGSDRDKHGGL